jgi:hypothetical protein
MWVLNATSRTDQADQRRRNKYDKSAKSSDSRGGLESQFGDGFRRNNDTNADPTDTEL